VAPEAIPGDLAYRLRPAEEVLWWGRPKRMPLVMPSNRWLGAPIFAIVVATVTAMAVVPQGWQTPVAVIFRSAIGFSAVSLIVTFLTIVARQRRRICYAVTPGRVLIVSGFWARGNRAWPLTHLVEISVQAHRDGTGTIWFGVASPRSFTGPSLTAYGGRADFVRPQLQRIADARRVCDLLVEARARGATPPAVSSS
jgi:hypothetical protein